jgi:hypothetical protein
MLSHLGNLGDPSPLQTRSARKKKAALGQNATPKLISPIKSATPVKAGGEKSSRKPTPGRPKIKQEPKSDEDVGENELDSDDLDSDDMDEGEDNTDQSIIKVDESIFKNILQHFLCYDFRSTTQDGSRA